MPFPIIMQLKFSFIRLTFSLHLDYGSMAGPRACIKRLIEKEKRYVS